jgi:hypothetical protein
MYEGKSISKLQIVIERKRMGMMAYKQHLFAHTHACIVILRQKDYVSVWRMCRFTKTYAE